jgi:hypothetical protein
VYDGFGCHLGNAPEDYVTRIENGKFYYRLTNWADFWGGDNDCFAEHSEEEDGCYFGDIPAGRTGFVNTTNEGARLSLESFYLEPVCEPFEHLANCADPCPMGGRFKNGTCSLISVPEAANGFMFDGNFYLSKHTDADPCPHGGIFDGSNCLVYRMPLGHSGALQDGNFVLNPVCERVPYFQGTGY